jgi:hypothetical protein
MTRHKRMMLLLTIPMLLAGCSAITGSSTATPGGGAGPTPNAGSDWLVLAQGSATPSPVPSLGTTPYPTASVGSGFLPLQPAARATPTATCGMDTVHFSRIGGLTVVPGTTSAKVTWYNKGGYNLVEYRLTAISQNPIEGSQRDVGWKTIKPTAPCGTISVTLPKLDRKTSYIFSLDAVVLRRSGDGTHAGTVMRSGVVYTK